MSNPTAEQGTPEALLEARRSRILESLSRTPTPIQAVDSPLTPEQERHLVRDAEELYWNELAWEEITDEERVFGGHLTELAFPAFLAFIDGLLLDSAPKRSTAKPRAHPDVVEKILTFLAERYAEASDKLESGADSEELVWARAMTARLIDLVFYRLYRLSDEECEAIEGDS